MWWYFVENGRIFVVNLVHESLVFEGTFIAATDRVLESGRLIEESGEGDIPPEEQT